MGELAELTRAAVRANTTIYTIDPRGLVGGPDLDEKIDMMEWLDHIRNTQDSLRVLADLTGGIAVVNSERLHKALKRIDQETSDYYVVGYYSTNPDPTKRRRTIEVKVTRAGANVWHRTSYTLEKAERAALIVYAGFTAELSSALAILIDCCGSRQPRPCCFTFHWDPRFSCPILHLEKDLYDYERRTIARPPAAG